MPLRKVVLPLTLAGVLVSLVSWRAAGYAAPAQAGSYHTYLPSLWNALACEDLPPVATAVGPHPSATAPNPTPSDIPTSGPSAAPTEEPTAAITEEPTATPTPSPTPTSALGGSIYGRLVQDGKPVFPGTGDGLGPALYLRHCQAGGSICRNVARTGAWEPEGGYRFSSPAPLGPGEFYQVVWWNEDKIPEMAGDYTALGRWFGPRITEFAGGQDVPGGDFELKDVVLTGPSKGTGYQGFPWEFTWSGRRFANESFRWAVGDCCLELAQRDNTIFMSPPLGSRQSYVVESLPPGLVWNVHYCWYVRVDSSIQYSFGESFYSWMLWFIPLFFDFGLTEPADWYQGRPVYSAQTWWSER